MYNKAIEACRSNAKALIDDSEILYEMERYNASFMLAILSQEESAKAFLLCLINDNIIPWTKEINRSLKNHECKHLIGELMFYLNPSFDIAIERSKLALKKFEPAPLPKHIADIINYFRHEKIGRWISPNWWWDEVPDYDKNIKQIAKGKIEKEKQNAIYCRVAKNGQFHKLNIDKNKIEFEINKAKQMLEIANGEMIFSFREYESIKNGFKAVFANMFHKTQKLKNV